MTKVGPGEKIRLRATFDAAPAAPVEVKIKAAGGAYGNAIVAADQGENVFEAVTNAAATNGLYIALFTSNDGGRQQVVFQVAED